jgi:flagellin
MMIKVNTNNLSGNVAFTSQTTIRINKDSSMKQLDQSRTKISTESSQFILRESMLQNYYKKLVARANSQFVGQENISDKSFVVETTNLSKTRIMSDASAAILAQASKPKYIFISLLESDT